MNTGKIEQGARFEQLIKNLGYNQSSFAKAFGTHQTNISLIVKGHRSIPSRILIDISKRHNANIDWITTGEGEMFYPEKLELNEPKLPYRKPTPGEQLQILLDNHDKRIDDLETEIRLLKDMEAEVHRLRGLVEGLVKGGVVKE